MTEGNKAFVLVISGKLKAGHMDKFQELFKPLAEHVQAHEDGCLAYELCVSDKDPDRLLIYERYISKEYMQQVHQQSEPFKKFKAGVASVGIEWELKEGHSYYETELGYMHKK